ncbi:MAG: hypothetical protein LBI72_14290 [Flavobacteriaceae bacterium]|nr:hypothetical protein [Flavobacteriaceae bacterium]
MKLFCVYLFGTIFSFSVYAQIDQANKGMHLLDLSSNNTTKGKLDLSILDLSSSEKGFMLPRMTTAERSGIPVSMLDSGLAIFNTTIDCIEYYNATQQRWLSVCGKQEPAVFDITAAKCSAITVDGNYSQGRLVDERSNLIFLDVNVSEPGTFSASAVAYNGANKNGYVFSTKGVFPAVGQYRIVLKGSGKPINGYGKDTSGNPLGKDTIKFYFNEEESTCTTTNFVDKDFEPLVAAFECNNINFPITAEGTYKEKEPLKSNNIIKVPLRVTKPGRGKVFGTVPAAGSQTELIQFESAVTDFKTTAANAVQWVTLKPVANTGKPTVGGKMTVNFRAVSNGLQEYDPFENATITEFANCSHDITVESDGPKFNLNRVNLQTKFFSNTGGKFYVTPRTNMGVGGSDDFSIIAYVTPKATGEYILETDTKNGIYFKGSRDITQTQVNAGTELSVTLKAYGTSKTDLKITDPEAKFTVTSNNNDTGLTSIKTLNVDFVYRTMNLYSVGDQAWHPGGSYSSSGTFDGGPALVQNSTHFGWNGVVRIDGLNIVAGAGTDTSNHITSTASSNVNKFKEYTDIADIIVIGGNTAGSNLATKRTVQMDYLFDWTKNSGALIYGEGDGTVLKGFMDKFEPGNTIGTQPSGTYLTSGSKMSFELLVQSQNAKKIIGTSDTYFSKYYSFKVSGGLQAKLIGTQYNTTTNTILSSMGSNFETIATTPGLGTFAFVHKSYGFAGIASATFMGGTRKDTGNDNNYPCRSDSNGELLTAPYTGGQVYNSLFLLNLMHWAIDYAQEHQPNKIKQ